MSTTNTTAQQPVEQAIPSVIPTKTMPGDGAVKPPSPPVDATSSGIRPKAGRRWWLWGIGGALVIAALIAGMPWVAKALSMVSTDDAYVNGHVTFVAPRVAGQVTRVLVDDNNRVRKGDLLVQLDKEPYQVQVDIAQAAVAAAQADLVTAQAQARGTVGQARSLRFNLQRAIEDVDNQIALLRCEGRHPAIAKGVAWPRRKPTTSGDKPLVKSGAMSKEEFDHRKEALLVAQAQSGGGPARRLPGPRRPGPAAAA